MNGLELIGLGIFGIWLAYVVYKEEIVLWRY
jgi:hypothetical protein